MTNENTPHTIFSFFVQYLKKDANVNVIEAILCNFDQTNFFYETEFQSSKTCMFIQYKFKKKIKKMIGFHI